MVKIVIKKEGATQTCGKCGTDIICRLKDYGGNFAPSLQWQNYDSTAHFKTNDGKSYACNVPDDDETGQTRITTAPTAATTPGNPTNNSVDLLSQLIAIKNTVENIDLRIQKMDEMVQAIFRHTIDEQLKKK